MGLKAGIMTIGHELLSGFTVDTNSSWMGQRLTEIGISVSDKISVGDTESEIHKGLTYLTPNCDVILVTGGLGPTHDDVTQESVFKFFKSKSSFDEKYWNELQERYNTETRKISELNKIQAIIPDNGDMIPNSKGTARGFHFIKSKKHYFFMPGVPAEMKGMMNDTILEILKDLSDTDLFVKTIRTTGIPESELVGILGKNRIHSDGLSIAFLPQSPGVDLRVSGLDNMKVEAWVNDVKTLLGKKVYGENSDRIEEIVANIFIEKGLTLSVAESCTGGLLGHRITSVPDSSKFFIGGVVAYDNSVKIAQLGLTEFELLNHGAVSEEVARHMAEGIRDHLKTDYGIGITGVAGPSGGTPEKPVGLVYIGMATPEETKVLKFQFKANREFNKLLASENALNLLRLHLLENE